MTSRLPFFVLATVLAATLTGCLGDGMKASLSGLAGGGGEPRQVAEAQVPAHAKVVVAAIVMRLRGDSPERVRKELSVQGSNFVAPEPGFGYDGFQVRNIQFLGHHVDPGDAGKMQLAGALHFEDPAGRRAMAAFRTSYTVFPSGLAITRALVRPMYPNFSEAEMFVVPAASLDKDAAAAVESYPELRRTALGSAVSLAQASAQPRDYVILVFFRDRLAPGDAVQVSVSDVRDGPYGHTESSRYRTYDRGWVVGMIPGRFALADDKAFWIKAVHVPRAEDGAEPEPQVMGLFSTAPGANQRGLPSS